MQWQKKNTEWNNFTTFDDMDTKQKIFELADLSQVYLTRQYRFTALKHINLTVEEGDFVALLGPSGCGKSTLLRIITGLQQPTVGKVIYKDVPLNGINENINEIKN